MSNTSPETLRQMRDLCAKISVAHDLDESIQEELRGHMEDKFIAYLSGDEPLSEQDAFILVREHFGDPATIKALMQDAHPVEVTASLARRIGAVLIATAAVEILIRYAFAANWWLIWRTAWTGGSGWFVIPVIFLGRFAPLIMLSLLLRRWQRMIAEGAKPWFLKTPPRVFVYVPFLLLSLWVFSGVIFYWIYCISPTTQTYAPPDWLNSSLSYAAATGCCLLWLWWCNPRPRRMLFAGVAVAGWAVLSLMQATADFVGAIVIQLYLQGLRVPSEPPLLLLIAQGYWQELANAGIVAVPSAALAIAIYVRFTRSLDQLPLDYQVD